MSARWKPPWARSTRTCAPRALTTPPLAQSAGDGLRKQPALSANTPSATTAASPAVSGTARSGSRNARRASTPALKQSFNDKRAYIHTTADIVTKALDERMDLLAKNVDADGPRVVVFNSLPWKRGGEVEVERTRRSVVCGPRSGNRQGRAPTGVERLHAAFRGCRHSAVADAKPTSSLPGARPRQAKDLTPARFRMNISVSWSIRHAGNHVADRPENGTRLDCREGRKRPLASICTSASPPRTSRPSWTPTVG